MRDNKRYKGNHISGLRGVVFCKPLGPVLNILTLFNLTMLCGPQIFFVVCKQNSGVTKRVAERHFRVSH